MTWWVTGGGEGLAWLRGMVVDVGIAGDAEVVSGPVRGTTGLAVSVGDDAEPDGAAG